MRIFSKKRLERTAGHQLLNALVKAFDGRLFAYRLSKRKMQGINRQSLG